MKIERNRNIVRTVLLLIGAWFGLFTILTTAQPKVEVAEIQPAPQEIRAEVFSRECDLLKVNSNWPKSLTVENISDKEVSGFMIEIFADNDDGGPGRTMGWGQRPGFGIQTPLFKPKEVVTLSIDPEIVRTFQENNKPLLYIQVADVWVNNDPVTEYKYGAVLKQDPNDPNRYVVVIDALGRTVTVDANGNRVIGPLPKNSKPQHNHASPVPHIAHSIKPPFR
jgi:hypothetical protein